MSIATKLTTIGAAGVGGEAYYVATFETQASGTCSSDCVCNYRAGSGCCTDSYLTYCNLLPIVDPHYDIDYDGNVYYSLHACQSRAFTLGKIDTSGSLEWQKSHIVHCTCESAGDYRYTAYRLNFSIGVKGENRAAMIHDSANNMVRMFVRGGTGASCVCCGGIYHSAFSATDGSCIANTICGFSCLGISGLCAVQDMNCSFAYLHEAHGSSTDKFCDGNAYCGFGIAGIRVCLCSDGTINPTLCCTQKSPFGPGIGCGFGGGGYSKMQFYRDWIKYCPYLGTYPQWWSYNSGNGKTILTCRNSGGNYNCALCSVAQAYGVAHVHCIRNSTCSFCCTAGMMPRSVIGTYIGRSFLFTIGQCLGAEAGIFPLCMTCIRFPLHIPCGENCNTNGEFDFKTDAQNIYYLYNGCLDGSCGDSRAMYLVKMNALLNNYCWAKKISVPIEYSAPCWATAGCQACCHTKYFYPQFKVDRCTDSIVLTGSYCRCCCGFADTSCYSTYGQIPFILRFSASEPPVGQYAEFCFEDFTFSFGTQSCRCFYTSCAGGCCFQNPTYWTRTYLFCCCSQVLNPPAACFSGTCTRQISGIQNQLCTEFTCITKI